MKNYLLILTILISAGCGNNASDHHHSEGNATEISEDHEHHTNIGLMLNNGDKWKSDASTHEEVQNMNSLIKNFNKAGAGVEAYHNLADQLTDHYAALVNKCTMKGEAHDQLHSFLQMLRPLINNLKKADDIQTADNIVAETKAVIDQYYVYFEYP